MLTAEQIRAARGLLKMEQQPIADGIGVSIATYKRWEAGTGPLRGAYDKVSALERLFIDRGWNSFLRTEAVRGCASKREDRTHEYPDRGLLGAASFISFVGRSSAEDCFRASATHFLRSSSALLLSMTRV